MNYREYLKRVDEIVAEPLPDDMTDSVVGQDESWLNAKLLMKKPIDGIRLPDWPMFSNGTLGIRPHEFTIWCGPTGVGKTTALVNLAAQMGKLNVPYFIGSVETGKDDFTRVLAGVLANVDPYKAHDENELKRIDTEFGYVLKNKQHRTVRYDSRVSHKRLLADLLYAVETYHTKLALIDNLNFLMEITSSKDQVMAMDKAVHDFVVFLKKVPVHVVMVMHPKKTDGGRVESEFDIKGSSTSVQEASNVILWNRLKDDSQAALNIPPQYCRELKFAKVRKNGRATGSRIIYSIDQKSPRLKEEKFG